ncbi:MAG: DegV family protein [Chloroflexi bacterium]|nr:DegV family protein [Chloroflexota bacterium]
MSIQVVTDSTATLPPEIAAELGITVIPTHVSFGTTSYRDGVDLEIDEFYRLLETSPDHPTTSQPNPAEFAQTYSQVEGDGPIVSIHVSTDLSKTVESARQGAAEVGREILVLDSRLVGPAMGFSVIAAARAGRDGASLEDIQGIVADHAERAHLVFVVQTLEYLKRGGRIGGAQAFLGSLLNVKPVLELADGVVAPVTRVRTMRKAHAAIADRVREQAPNGVSSWAILHAQAQAEHDRLKRDLADGLNADGDTIPNVPIGPVVGTHTGPGAFGFAFVAKA